MIGIAFSLAVKSTTSSSRNGIAETVCWSAAGKFGGLFASMPQVRPCCL